MSICVDSEFDGGNIIVEKNDGNTVYLKPDYRDSHDGWFYWNFRVSKADEGTYKFFISKDFMTEKGPAFSLDRGQTWQWLDKENIYDEYFAFEVTSEKEIRFSMGMPYTKNNWSAFIDQYQDHEMIHLDILGQTNKGRDIPVLSWTNGTPQFRVLITARHHACEMMSNYLIEGMIKELCSSGALQKEFHDKVGFTIIPFVDLDGVEEGDQGKARYPHDHNRDYIEKPIYSSVKLIQEEVLNSQLPYRISFDLHNPHLRGANNENLYFVGSKDLKNWEAQKTFAKLLEKSCLEENGFSGLPYKAVDDIPFGQSWNKGEGLSASCTAWMVRQVDIVLGQTLELPYSSCGDHTVTQENSRVFGKKMMCAIQAFIKNEDL